MMKHNYVIRILSILLAVVFVFAFAACGKADNAQDKQAEERQESRRTAAETVDNGASEESSGTTDTASESGNTAQGDRKILIAYFTAAENSGVDAVASASYTTINGTAVGRLRAVADMIQENTDGDMFSIQTSVVYPADGGELIDYAAEEQDENARPELTSQIEDIDQYDTVFIGFPTWWYDMPQALYSFFDAYDFSGKTIIPFNVHNGSRFSGTIDTIKELEPDAMVIEDGFTVSERDVADAAEDVAEWLAGLGY